MAKLIVWNLMSLDGFFEGPDPADFSWHMSAWSEDLEALSTQQGEDAAALVFGRVTYQGMASFWPHETGPIADFMNTTPKFAASHTLQRADWAKTTLTRDPAKDVAALKSQSAKNVYVFGSANLCSTLRQHDLIDEWRVCVAPIFLGAGAPLFKAHDPAHGLALLEARALQKGAVLLRYAPMR